MKRPIKIALISTLVTLVAAYIIGSGIQLSIRDQQERCEGVSINILDSHLRQYVPESELVSLLRQKDLYPDGKPLRQVFTARIEAAIEAHPMVRDAEVYRTSDNRVHIDLYQRQPLLRVVAIDANYYVDTDHQQMPVRESIHDKVLRAEGKISTRMAIHELAELAEWITQNPYWHPRIRCIRVRNPRHIELTQYGTETTILLGSVDGFETKMNKLQRLYQGGYESLEQRDYRELDLRFADQVVGRR